MKNLEADAPAWFTIEWKSLKKLLPRRTLSGSKYMVASRPPTGVEVCVKFMYE